MPHGQPVETGSDYDRAERACLLGSSCPCPHTSCRRGWTDREAPTGVVRCPACWQAYTARRTAGASHLDGG